MEEDYKKGDVIVNFILVSGVLVIAGLTLTVVGDQEEPKNKSQRRSEA